MNDQIRNRAINAADLLNDFIGDLITGVMVLREYNQEHQRGKVSSELMPTIQRMCLSHLIITLSKWLEFYEKFHDLIPDECRVPTKSLNSEIKKRKIKEFRNKCVGHIWDKDQNRSFYHSEIMERLNLILNGNISNFLDWVNNPKANTFPNTVVSIVEEIKNELVREYEIKPNEIIER